MVIYIYIYTYNIYIYTSGGLDAPSGPAALRSRGGASGISRIRFEVSTNHSAILRLVSGLMTCSFLLLRIEAPDQYLLNSILGIP